MFLESLTSSSFLSFVCADDCRPCPENGRCQDGKLHCLPGYKVQGRLCVPDKQIDQGAQRLVRVLPSAPCTVRFD